MDLRLVSASLLLLGNAAIAQAPAPAPAPATPAPAAPAPAAPAAQDKAKPAPADVLKELQAERDRLSREIAYVQDRAKNAKAILAEKLAPKTPTYKSIDAGAPPVMVQPTPVAQPPRAPRIATPEELANHPGDTLFIVEGRAITQPMLTELVEYMATTPAGGDEATRTKRALADLIRIEAVASTFEEGEIAERVSDLQSQLDAGKNMSELAKAVGAVPGGNPDGRVDVTRNSVFGPRFEQIAFSTEPGKRARPFRNANGVVLLQVDSLEKGASPDQDRVVGTAIQVAYAPDSQAVGKAHTAINSGQITILARDEKTLGMLPEMFRRMAGVTPPMPAVDNAAVRRQLEQLNADIQALQGKTDAESKAKLEQLQRAYAQLKDQLRSAGTDESVVEVKSDAPPPPKPVKKD